MATATAEPKAAPAPQPQLEILDDKAIACYANFCRVIGTPEELIVDFALNPSPMETLSIPLNISQRVILNYYTAKRLFAALQMSLQRHENAFGNVETDIQRRVVPSALRRT